jgi:hypothetical protein
MTNKEGNMTNQERLRKSVKYRLMRKLWVKAGDVSRWAGRRIVEWSREADEMDYPEINNVGKTQT